MACPPSLIRERNFDLSSQGAASCCAALDKACEERLTKYDSGTLRAYVSVRVTSPSSSKDGESLEFNFWNGELLLLDASAFVLLLLSEEVEEGRGTSSGTLKELVLLSQKILYLTGTLIGGDGVLETDDSDPDVDVVGEGDIVGTCNEGEMIILVLELAFP